MNTNRPSPNLATSATGLLLILVGALLLFANWLRWSIVEPLWPLFIVMIGPVFFVDMIAGGKSTGGLAIPDSIITIAGLILFFQNLFGHWEGWANTWALTAPLAWASATD